MAITRFVQRSLTQLIAIIVSALAAVSTHDDSPLSYCVCGCAVQEFTCGMQSCTTSRTRFNQHPQVACGRVILHIGCAYPVDSYDLLLIFPICGRKLINFPNILLLLLLKMQQESVTSDKSILFPHVLKLETKMREVSFRHIIKNKSHISE